MNNLRHTIIINATLQLQKEYDYICFQYKLKLKKPLIIIEELTDSFGKWDEYHNTIFLAEHLIFNHAWHKVINVLKHEIAHQIVSQIFRSTDTHGADFKKATQWLGLDAFYAKASLSMSEDFPSLHNANAGDEELNILRKVERLLNLAESSNEHEALLAMDKVREIYKKYNIERFTKNENTSYTTLTINLNLKKIPSNAFIISDILQQHFFVSNIFSKIYVPVENCEHRCLVVMGEKHNVLMAEHVYEFLTHKVSALWLQYQKAEKLSAKFKASYQKGLLAGFSSKLDSLKKESFSTSTKNEKALVIQYEVKLGEYVKTQFPKTSSVQQSGLLYKDHYDKGTQEGHRINLSRPISEQGTASLKRFLTSGTTR